MSLRAKAFEALLWGTGFRIFRDLLQFGLMLVLVRILAPAEYGRYGLLTSVVGFLGLFAAKNFFGYFLQVRRDSALHLQDHFTAGAAIQGVLFVVANALALLLRASDTYRPIAPLLHVTSLLFLIELPGEFCSKLLERQLAFRRLRTLGAVALVVTASVALAMALSGAGVWALVVPPLLASLPFAWELLWRQRFRPTWEFHPDHFRPTALFTAARIASGGLNGARELLQNGLVVRFFGFATLGVYGRAVGLGNLLCASVASQFVSNLYPVLTRSDVASPAFQRASGLLLRGVTWLVVPVAAVLGLLAAPVVQTVYGARWDAVIPLMPVAMVENVVRSVAATLYALLLAAQQQRRCLLQDSLVLLLVLGCLVFGLPGGVRRYLALLAVAEACGGALMVWWLVKGNVLDWKAVAVAGWPAFAAGLAGSGVVWVGSRLLGEAARHLPVAALLGVGCVVVYGAVIRVGFPRQLLELLELLPGGGWVAQVLWLRMPAGTCNGGRS